MDIELSDGNSFEIFHHKKITTPIIFTTAYNDFAIQAFKVNSINYLLKPYSLHELEKAIVKLEQITSFVKLDYTEIISSFSPKKSRDRILISIGDNYSFVKTTDVAYFLRDEKYVYVILNNGIKNITDFMNLKKFLRLDYLFTFNNHIAKFTPFFLVKSQKNIIISPSFRIFAVDCNRLKKVRGADAKHQKHL